MRSRMQSGRAGTTPQLCMTAVRATGSVTEEEKVAWKQELARNMPESPQRVLDIGCGTGVMGLLFAEMGHQVTGVDLSEAMIAKAREKADAQNLPIELEDRGCRTPSLQ